jgi:hypothetical protein
MLVRHSETAIIRSETRKGVYMPSKKNVVNLDALIIREDFEAEAPPGVPQQPNLADKYRIKDFEPGEVFSLTLRKPDFQRETASWSPEKVASFIDTFVRGDLVPAVIMWNSKGNNFVIDGGHRISALIAWVLDDYGDQAQSNQFFEFSVSDEQKRMAQRTRDLIKTKLGFTYADVLAAGKNPATASQKVLSYAKRLATHTVQVQWIVGADAKAAEQSFFRINQSAEPLEASELNLLLVRLTPNALAARAIVRAGTGHKYWRRFEEHKQKQIEDMAENIHKSLFLPPLETPIKTLDLPIAGKGYSSLPLIFDMVNIINPQASPQPDATGDTTIDCLKHIQRVVVRISGKHSSSLGLHPAVYFYGSNGRYQQTAFLAIVSLFKEFDANDRFSWFTTLRDPFEEYLLKHKNFINDVTFKFGSGLKGYSQLETLYRLILARLDEHKSVEEIDQIIHDDGRFPYLIFDTGVGITGGKKMSQDTKSAVALRDLLVAAVRCPICNTRLHVNSFNIDHVVAKSDGGLGTTDNGQMAHFYCNSTVKN